MRILESQLDFQGCLLAVWMISMAPRRRKEKKGFLVQDLNHPAVDGPFPAAPMRTKSPRDPCVFAIIPSLCDPGLGTACPWAIPGTLRGKRRQNVTVDLSFLLQASRPLRQYNTRVAVRSKSIALHCAELIGAYQCMFLGT
jgi:hypothetical protein